MLSFEERYTKRHLQHHVYKEIGEIITSNALIMAGSAILINLSNVIKIASEKKCKIYIVEKDYVVFEEMKKQMCKLPGARIIARIGGSVEIIVYSVTINGHSNKVILIRCNVTDYEDELEDVLYFENGYENIVTPLVPPRYIDIDPCETIKATGHIFKRCLSNQAKHHTKKYKELRKVFMGTVCLRGCSMQYTIEYINAEFLSILGTETDVEDVGPYGKHFSKYLPCYDSSVNNISMYKPKILKQGRVEAIRIYSYRDDTPMLCFVITYK